MKGSWGYHFSSNSRRISTTFCAAILLFVGTEAAAELIIPPVVFHSCLPKKLETVTSSIPLPDPAPLSIGCLIPGCDLAVAGPLELHVELSGDLMPSALLEITGLSQDQIRMLRLSGEVQAVPDQRTTFKVERGRSHVSGLRVDLGTRLRTEELVTRLMAQTATPIIPTIQLRLSIDAEKAEKWTTKKGTVEAKNSEPKIAIDLKVIQGKTTINESSTEYVLIQCHSIPTHSHDAHGPPIGPITLDVNGNPVDWIHVTEQIGGVETDFGDDALVLANGRIENGSATPPLTNWVEPRAYKGKAFFPMPQNIWSYDPAKSTTDESNNCEQLDYAGTPESCWPEVSVFARGRAMTLKRVSEWSNDLGDLVPVSVKVPPEVVKVPVYFYILWENAAKPVPNPGGSPCTPADSTYCLAHTRLTDAREFYSTIMSGIDFEPTEVIANLTSNSDLINSGCGDRSRIQSFLGLDSSPIPTGLWVYFVRTVVEETIGGRLIHNAQTCSQPAFQWDITLPTDVHPAQLDEIFISTGMAPNPTTLAHEFGHAFSLDDVNASSTTAKSHAGNLQQNNLMWTGSNSRDNATIAQIFRMNTNKLSAVHRLNAPGRISDLPRWCLDYLKNKTCPALYLTP